MFTVSKRVLDGCRIHAWLYNESRVSNHSGLSGWYLILEHQIAPATWESFWNKTWRRTPQKVMTKSEELGLGMDI